MATYYNFEEFAPDLHKMLLERSLGGATTQEELDELSSIDYSPESSNIPTRFPVLRQSEMLNQERQDVIAKNMQSIINSERIPEIMSEEGAGLESTYQNIPALSQVQASSYEYHPISYSSNVGDLAIMENQTKGRGAFLNNLWGYTTEIGFGQTIIDSIDRGLEKKNYDDITKAEAEQLSKRYGLDIKWDKKKDTLNSYEVYQRIEKALAIKGYQQMMQEYESTMDSSLLSKASVFATSIGATFFGTPFDVAGTLASVFAPELLIGTVSKTAGALRGVFGTQKVLEAGMTVRRAKASTDAVRALQGAQNVPRGLATYAKSRYINPGVISEEAKRMSALQLENIALLDKMSRWDYANLSVKGKLLADASGVVAYDTPQAFYKYNQSKESGLDYYTRSDLLAEILGASLLGVALPGAVRGVGKALGISPREMRIRQYQDAITDVELDAAKGNISERAMNQSVKVLNNLIDMEKSMEKGYKGTHPFIKQQSDALEREMIPDEVVSDNLNTVLSYLRDPDKNVRHLKISDLKASKNIYSKFSKQVLSPLAVKHITEVLGRNLLYDRGRGSFTVILNGEEGLLGSNRAWGLTQRKAADYLDLAYKAYLFDDAKAFEKMSLEYARDMEFENTLSSAYEKFKADREANRAGKNKVKLEEMAQLQDIFKEAYLKRMLGDDYDAYKTLLDEKTAQEILGWPSKEDRARVTEGLKRFETAEKEAEEFTNKHVIKEEYGNTNQYMHNLVNEKEFTKYLEDLSAGVDSNGRILKYEDYYNDLDAARIESLAEETLNGTILPDTDEFRILGNPRLDSQKLAELDSNKVEWNKRSNLAEQQIRETQTSDSYVNVNKYWKGPGNPIDAALSFCDSIHALQKEHYASVIKGIVDSARADEGLTKSIIGYMADFNLKDSKAVRNRIKEIVSKRIDTFPDIIPSANKGRIVNDITKSLLDDIEKKPENLIYLMNDASVEAISPGSRIKPEMKGPDFTPEQLAEKQEKLTQLESEYSDFEKYKPSSGLKKRTQEMKDAGEGIWDKNVKREHEDAYEGEIPKEFRNKIIVDQIRSKQDAIVKKANLIAEVRKEIAELKSTSPNSKRLESKKEKEIKYTQERKALADEIKELSKKYNDDMERIAEEMKTLRKELGYSEQYAKEVAEFDRVRAQEFTEFQKTFAPLINELDIELSALAVEKCHNAKIMADAMELMLMNPGRASEVLIKAATQTPYAIKGANRNLEYILRGPKEYIQGMRNDIKKHPRGMELLEYLDEDSNRDDIMAALIRRRSGDVSSANSSDADIIAKYIDECEASLDGSFSKYGSRYTHAQTLLNMNKLAKDIDKYISDNEVSSRARGMIYDASDASKKAKGMLQYLEESNGLYKYGANMVNEEKAIKYISGALTEIQRISESLFNYVEDANYKRVISWVLRDFDLERTFNVEGKASMNLNDVRSFLETKDWSKVLKDKDIMNLTDLKQSLSYLHSRLIGNKEWMSLDIHDVSPTSWTGRFINSFQNTAASKGGIKSSYLAEQRARFYFKSPEAEIAATKQFSYDTVQDMMSSNLRKTLNAKYTLENFGSDPIKNTNDLIDNYNEILKGDYMLKLKDIANSISTDRFEIKPLIKYTISSAQKSEINRLVEDAVGLQNTSLGAMGRIYKIVSMIGAAPLLTGAGLRSFGDWGTIHAGLVTNALASRTEAMALMGQAMELIARDNELAHLVAATSLAEADALAHKITTSSIENIVTLSAKKNSIETMEEFTRKWSDFFFNKLGHIEDVTNLNKMVAGLSIQLAIAKKAATPFDGLAKDLQLMLRRESIDKVDWEIMRNNCLKDLYQSSKIERTGVNVFDPLKAREISDEVLEKALHDKGHINVTSEMISNYRDHIASKAWNMVDTSADEMVSLPSNRVMSAMRFGRPKGDALATLAEIVTQFKSFGASLAVSTYGKKIANSIDGEVGITILDMFNPFVRVNKAVRANMYKDLVFNTGLSVALATIAWDTITDAAKGRREMLMTEDGVNWGLVIKRLEAPLGLAGDLLDTAWTGFEGTGQGAGGITAQIAPGPSNYIRVINRLARPLKSSRVDNKGEAFAAATASEAARVGGLSTLPFVSIGYQFAVGAKLDSMAKGGSKEWDRYIKAREDRHENPYFYERDPKFFWERGQ